MAKELTKRQLQARESKKKIHNSAIRLWQEHDYEKVTIEQLCSNAGVSAGLFYNYYGSKEDVLRGDYELFDQIIDQAGKKFPASSNLDAIRMTEYLHACYSAAVGYKIVTQWYRIHLSVTNADIPSESAMLNRNIHNLTIRALKAGELHRAWDGETASRLILSHTRGTVFDWAMRKGSYDLVERMAGDLEIVLALLKQELRAPVSRRLLAAAKKFFTGLAAEAGL
ncbi:MAG: TetR/AcrR family transcriptional regulator [Spirochaetaceae bacterium]|nr:TetR/AcrR family transcriptional regulator [Spirochaetaceae bacterium]